MRLLITGSNGLLGQKLVDYCKFEKIDFLATSLGSNRNSKCSNRQYQSLDITNVNEVNQVLTNFRPTHIINTAALTNVDQCEDNNGKCHKINVLGVVNLLEYAKTNKCHLQQISTDFIFDGEKGDYTENDEPNPISEYGKSKLIAEEKIRTSGYKNYSIVRTSVVYGSGENLSKSNIVLWAIEELKRGNTLNIVNDQYRAPTFAQDLAVGCMKILLLNETGLFNMSGPKTHSMFEFVVEIAEYLEISNTQVNSITTDMLNQKAPRPKNSGLNLTKSKQVLNYSSSDIKSALFLMEVDF
ncbi:MAG: NAD(P)-dependent oxidoreductase [Fluviicola sp.]|nr:MAG: NAD(P)-dependent oxidoreductase [Fluviicola sp.]